MNTKEAIKHNLDFNYMAMKQMLADLSDADLLVRPVPNANHIAWQLGHLITSEVGLLNYVPGARPAELPAGFAEKHDRKNVASDAAADFLSREQYLALFDRVRAGTEAALGKVSDTDLDQKLTGDVARYCPTVGAVFMLLGGHIMMHAGQFTVVRRKLGKPILF
jgi:hypothetical protein